MKSYMSPNVEFIEFKNEDIIITSNYVCPNEYGNSCSGNPYEGD